MSKVLDYLELGDIYHLFYKDPNNVMRRAVIMKVMHLDGTHRGIAMTMSDVSHFRRCNGFNSTDLSIFEQGIKEFRQKGFTTSPLFGLAVMDKVDDTPVSGSRYLLEARWNYKAKHFAIHSVKFDTAADRFTRLTKAIEYALGGSGGGVEESDITLYQWIGSDSSPNGVMNYKVFTSTGTIGTIRTTVSQHYDFMVEGGGKVAKNGRIVLPVPMSHATETFIKPFAEPVATVVESPTVPAVLSEGLTNCGTLILGNSGGGTITYNNTISIAVDKPIVTHEQLEISATAETAPVVSVVVTPTVEAPQEEKTDVVIPAEATPSPEKLIKVEESLPYSLENPFGKETIPEQVIVGQNTAVPTYVKPEKDDLLVLLEQAKKVTCKPVEPEAPKKASFWRRVWNFICFWK
jgi:hypothetical protein